MRKKIWNEEAKILQARVRPWRSPLTGDAKVKLSIVLKGRTKDQQIRKNSKHNMLEYAFNSFN